jgi:hypothetical protein
MPLSQPAARERLHTRRIEITGYARADGLYDIEAHLTDTKPDGRANYDRGWIGPEDPIHDMWLRFTMDETMLIHAVEACSDKTPYAACPAAAPNFSSLAGLRIQGGFLKEAGTRVGGACGCTHLRELLQQIATTAFQTIKPHVVTKRLTAQGVAFEDPYSDVMDQEITNQWGAWERIVNSCLAYSDKGDVVRRRWPDYYRGDQVEAATPDSGPSR